MRKLLVLLVLVVSPMAMLSACGPRTTVPGAHVTPTAQGKIRSPKDVICDSTASCAQMGYNVDIVYTYQLTGTVTIGGGGGGASEVLDVSQNRSPGGSITIDCDAYPDNPNCIATATVDCTLTPNDPACDGTSTVVWPSWLSFPSRSFIYFNVGHFWSQHLACYLKSSQDAFLDAVAADLNMRISSGQGPTGPASVTYDFTFNDQGTQTPIEYRASRPGADYLVGTAYIPGRPNC